MTSTASTPTATTPAPAAPPGVPRRAWAALAVIMTAEMMDGLDALIASIGSPRIVADIGGGGALIQWIATTYTLAMACGLLIGGRLGDRFGTRRLFLIGMTGFLLGSIIAASAVSPAMMITGRVVQGVLGAVMIPQGMSMIRRLFPGDQATRAFGLTGPVMMISGIGGPILAGALLAWNPLGLGWRSVFAINIIPCVLALLAGVVLLPPDTAKRRIGIDTVGALLVAAAMGAIVYPLVEGRTLGWPIWTFALLGIGVALLLVFVRQQRAQARRGRDPLIEPSLFHRRSFIAGLALTLVVFGGTGAVGLVTALYLQMGLGMTPLITSIITCFEAVGMLAGMFVSNSLGASRRTMGIGMGGIAIGQALTIASVWVQGSAVNPWLVGPAMVLSGVAIGVLMGPFFAMIIGGVDDTEAGSASGAMTSVQQLSTALGVAALGSVFFAVAGSGHGDRIALSHALEAAIAVNVVLILVSLPLLRLLPERVEGGPEMMP